MNRSATETVSGGPRHRFSKIAPLRKEGFTNSDIQKMSAPKLVRKWPKIVAQFASKPRILKAPAKLKTPAIAPNWECASCGEQYNEQRAVVKIDARGRRMMACPKCGSMNYKYLSASDRKEGERKQGRDHYQRHPDVRRRYRQMHKRKRAEQSRRYAREQYGWEPAPHMYKFNPGPSVRDLIPDLGEVLKSRRKLLGLSLREVASRAGLACTTVWRLETNGDNPRCGTFLRLAGVLGLETTSVIAEGRNEISIR